MKEENIRLLSVFSIFNLLGAKRNPCFLLGLEFVSEFAVPMVEVPLRLFWFPTCKKHVQIVFQANLPNLRESFKLLGTMCLSGPGMQRATTNREESQRLP